MAKRDPSATALRRRIDAMTEDLESNQAVVVRAVGCKSVHSLHAILGSKHHRFTETKSRVIGTPEGFWIEWLRGMERYIDDRGGYDARYSELLRQCVAEPKVQAYARTFQMRTFLRNAEALSKKRPTDAEAEVWIGANDADYGLLVSPRFAKGDWENDKSEIRHFKKGYFTIGHVLETGLLIPGKNKRIRFGSVDDYLTFFENTLVRAAGSKHQNAIAEQYVAYVGGAKRPEDVPLLLPEVRYSRERRHKYRLDFMVVEPEQLSRVGFEISPFSSHGRITGTSKMKASEINAAVRANREAELKKLRDYFLGIGVPVVVFTDAELAVPGQVFEKISRYLDKRRAPAEQEDAVLARLLMKTSRLSKSTGKSKR